MPPRHTSQLPRTLYIAAAGVCLEAIDRATNIRYALLAAIFAVATFTTRLRWATLAAGAVLALIAVLAEEHVVSLHTVWESATLPNAAHRLEANHLTIGHE